MKINYPVFLSLCMLLLLSCTADDDIADERDYWESLQPFSADYDTRHLAETHFFSGEAIARGEVELQEASGLAWSRNNRGFLWTHQDNGNENHLFLLDSKSGEIMATYRIQGIDNRDWEDMEIAPGPLDGHSYLYIGDTGDNKAVYGSYTIYRFEEPHFEESQRGEITDLEVEVDQINYRYPGRNHDVEALMVDPLTKDIYLVTKRDARAVLYVAPYPQMLEEEITVLKGGEFSFWAVTAATVSEDGREILIKNYDQIFYWQRQDNEPLVEALARAPLAAPYSSAEPQGEAVCFDDKGGYYTLSELSMGVKPVLYYYGREE